VDEAEHSVHILDQQRAKRNLESAKCEREEKAYKQQTENVSYLVFSFEFYFEFLTITIL